MFYEILTRYVHFLSLFIMIAALSSQAITLRDTMHRKYIRRLSVIDAFYGFSAILVVGAGMMLWLVVGKPGEFYSQNYYFLVKMGLVILLGLLSLHPTIFFLRKRKGENPDEMVAIPASVKWVIRLELFLLLFIPLCATLMAKGIGYFGN